MPAKKTTSNTRKPQRGGAKKNSSGGDSKQLVRDVTGVVILCLGVLSVYFAFTPNAVGFPGVVRSIMTGLAGVLCFAIPIILCWAALILLFSTRQRRISPVRVALLSALIAIVFGVFELFAMDGLLADLRQTNYASFLLHAFRAQTGGGLIGAITVWPLYIGLGLHVAGSLIVYIALALIDLILLRKISMSRIRERAVDGLANVQQHMTQQREARAERREARIERREAERLIRAQEMVIPSVAPAGEQPKKAPNTAQDAFSAKETPVASKAAAKASVVETVEPPTSARSTARPVREKP
ncbi:MAG: hypothetical protein Q4A66_11665, partial [Eubacteriales bacterium]|nr:hypothetical protein [Eubacteriales bacterium]